MGKEITNICAFIIAICFVVIACSQFQQARFHRDIAESLKVLAANEAYNATHKYPLQSDPGFNRARSLGWSLESSFLYAVGSRHKNPETAKEVAADSEKESAAYKARELKIENCIKSKNLPLDAPELEKREVRALCELNS